MFSKAKTYLEKWACYHKIHGQLSGKGQAIVSSLIMFVLPSSLILFTRPVSKLTATPHTQSKSIMEIKADEMIPSSGIDA